MNSETVPDLDKQRTASAEEENKFSLCAAELLRTYLCHGRPPRGGGPGAERRDEHEPPQLAGVVAVAEARVDEALHHAVVQVRLGLHKENSATSHTYI